MSWSQLLISKLNDNPKFNYTTQDCSTAFIFFCLANCNNINIKSQILCTVKMLIYYPKFYYTLGCPTTFNISWQCIYSIVKYIKYYSHFQTYVKLKLIALLLLWFLRDEPICSISPLISYTINRKAARGRPKYQYFLKKMVIM